MSNPNFIIEKKAELLANSLVPDKFRYSEPQFYELIKSFLLFLNDSIEVNNKSFFSVIDVSSIDSDELLYIYFETYLKTLGLPEGTEFSQAQDFLRVSKELAGIKGTPFIYAILLNLLVYLIPSIKSEYQRLLDLITDPSLTPEEIQEIQDVLGFMVSEGLTAVESEYEEVSEFTYNITASAPIDVFNTYVKPFCHPAGWKVQFLEQVSNIIVEYMTIYEELKIVSAYDLPVTIYGIVFGGNGCDLVFPDTGLCTDVFDSDSDITNFGSYMTLYPLGPDTELATFQSQVLTPSNLFVGDGMVYYSTGQVILVQTTSNRDIVQVVDGDSVSMDIRYIDATASLPIADFPAPVTYETNHKYLKAQGGGLTQYNGASIAYDEHHTREYI